MEEKERLTKSSICQLIKCKSLKCTFRNKRKAQIQPCGDVYSSLYGYFNLEDDYDENLHNKNDSRFDIISVEEYISKYFDGDKLSSYEDSLITYVHNNMEKLNRVIADLEAKLAEKDEEIAYLTKQVKKFNNEAQKYFEDAYCNDFHNQDKISFAVEQLENFLKTIHSHEKIYLSLNDFKIINEIFEQQIKQLKGE